MGGALPRACGRAAGARAGRARRALGCPRRRRSRASPSRGAARRRGDPPAGDDALAVAALLRLLRHLELGAGDPRRSSWPRPSTRTRSSGERLRPRPSSKESCSTGWRAAGASGGLAWPHRGHGLDVDAGRARRCGSSRRSDASSSPPSTHSSVEKAVKTLGLELRRTPVDDAFRLRPDALDLAVRAPSSPRSERRRRRPSILFPRSRTRASAMASGSTSTPRTRVGDGVPGAAVGVRGSRPGGLARRQRAQVDARARRLLARLEPAARGAACRVRPGARVPPNSRRGRGDRRVRACARPPLPLAEAVGGASLLRAHGVQRLIREHIRLAELFESWVRDESGWEISAPRHFSLVCSPRGLRRGERRALERVNASGESFSHTKLDGRYVLRLAIGQERTTEDDVRVAWDVLRREAAGL